MDGKNINNIKGVSNSTANNKIPNNQKVTPLPNLKKSLPNPQNANILNKRNEDIQRLNQALSKKRELENKQENTQEQEKKTIGQKVDKVGEEAVRNFGGKALTAATGGAVSGPAADAIANAVAKPVGKMLKYSLFITVAPILFILLICFSIFAAYYTLEEGSGSSDSEISENTSEGGVCSYNVSGKNVSNIKVRLLQCPDGKEGEPIEGEELVDFEKYILGVVYAEVGGGAGAGAKAQAIAARSYSLIRTNPAGETGPKKQSDGTWVISLRNCTRTQVYCDPDKGCTVKNGATNATNNTVYSGKIAGKQQYKGPMAQNDKTREAIASTAGRVALNAKGEVSATDYTQTQQDLFDKYETLEKISFDYAVVEHEEKIEVMRFSGMWKDLGTWNTLTEAMDSHNVGQALFSETCQNVHVVNELNLPVLCMGLKDVVVSASPDGILVSDKKQSSYIKPFVNTLDHRVMFAEKSWGSFRVLDVEKESLTIKVTLNSGHKMNYHSHEFRDEVWTIISGTGCVILNEKERNVKPGDVIEMKAGCRHTIIAETELKVIEVQMGKNVNVHDKIKYEI